VNGRSVLRPEPARRNHHLFQPLLYQVATAVLSPGDIASPIRWILRSQRNARVLLAEVTGIDTAARTVTLDGRDTVPYDQLIVAAGATHSYFGHDAWAPHAPAGAGAGSRSRGQS
jgi:NADH dehydrogenase